jgi:hypothetical protein
MLSRLTMLFFLLVHLPQNLFAVEDPIFYSGFESTGIHHHRLIMLLLMTSLVLVKYLELT